MKRWLWMTALLIAATAQQGQAQNPGDSGPGAGGSTLRLPGMETPSAPAIPPSPSLRYAWNPAATAAARIAMPPSNSVDINKDVTITPEVGPWTILVMSYSTPRDNPALDAAKMAREFVNEWNSNPTYARFKLKAHVFNYGAEEKQKEFERVQKLRQEQINALNQMGFDGKMMPIRIHTVHIDEHTAVLLGGFHDADAAMKVAKEIRTLPLPDVKRVKLDRLLGAIYEANAPGRNGQVMAVGDQYSNPFAKAMPVRNPAAPKAQANGMTPKEELEELDYLRKINTKETLSLLKTKRPFTLAVKQFNSSYKATTDAKDAESFFKQLTAPFGKQTEIKDYALQNAHNLADGLRKAKLEAYVLHCQCCSYVTIGSFNSPQDPELVQMQRFLEGYFRQESFQILDMFEHPTPMKVPGY